MQMTNLHIENTKVASLRPFKRNARTHSDKQIHQIAASIKTFGFTNPVLIDAGNTIIVGHGRVEAAKQLKLSKVPTIRLEHLSETQLRAYVLADNRLPSSMKNPSLWTTRRQRHSLPREWQKFDREQSA
jgi:ParB-like chromosome segregation protein Spo0J